MLIWGKKPLKKKGCGLILGDQVKGRTLLFDVVGVENSENTKRLLNYAKEKYNLNPSIVTLDLSPNLIGPIKEISGEQVLQIDGFHVMQELNVGIRRDLLDYRNRLFRDEIRDLSDLHHWIIKIQKEISVAETCSKIILKQKPLQKSKITKNSYIGI